MKHLTLILVLLTLGIAGMGLSADAETLYTSALFSRGTEDSAQGVCSVLNISSADITVTATLLNQAAEVIDTHTLTIAPGQVDGISEFLPIAGLYYCKFVVPNTRKVRAILQITGSDPASPGVEFVRATSEAR